MLEPLFNKVTGLKACNVIKKRLYHRCFPGNIAKFLSTPILKNICEPLPLTFSPNQNSSWEPKDEYVKFRSSCSQVYESGQTQTEAVVHRCMRVAKHT